MVSVDVWMYVVCVNIFACLYIHLKWTWTMDNAKIDRFFLFFYFAVRNVNCHFTIYSISKKCMEIVGQCTNNDVCLSFTLALNHRYWSVHFFFFRHILNWCIVLHEYVRMIGKQKSVHFISTYSLLPLSDSFIGKQQNLKFRLFLQNPNAEIIFFFPNF